MPQILLHVGMQKTATTTLQETLAANARRLGESGILYPETGRTGPDSPCHHALFLPAATSLAAIPTPFKAPAEGLGTMAARIGDERRRSDASSIILSSEMLWNRIAYPRAALARIRDAFPTRDFVILAYLRPPDRHVLSDYGQRVVGPQRYSASFSKHLAETKAMETYDFVGRLDDFAAVFGFDAVRPVWLPRLARDVLSPFREVLPVLAGVATVTDRNVRRSWLYVAITRRLNKFECRSTRRTIGSIRRALLPLDAVAKNFSPLETAFNPMDKATDARPKEDAAAALRAVEAKYRLRP